MNNLTACFLHWPHYFFSREQALKKRLALVHESLNAAVSDSSSHRRDNAEQIARLTQAHRWMEKESCWITSLVFVHQALCAQLESKLKSHLDLFVAAKPWVRTVRYGGSIGSRCGGWSRNWRPRWRVDMARAELQKLQRKPWSGGGKRLFYKTSSLRWKPSRHPHLNHISYMYKYDEYRFLLLSILY